MAVPTASSCGKVHCSAQPELREDRFSLRVISEQRLCGHEVVPASPPHARSPNPSPHVVRSALRYIAEFPPHNLTVVGSDDGHSWWSARGGFRNSFLMRS